MKRTPVPGTEHLLSLTGYAAHRKARGLRGGSEFAVKTALKFGRIHRTCPDHVACPTTCSQGGFDPALADVEWTRSTTGISVESQEPLETLADGRASSAIWKAKLMRLEYERISGQLVAAAEVKAAQYRTGRMIRDSMQMIPRRVAGVLVGMTDRRLIEEMLEDEIRRALDGLGKETVPCVKVDEAPQVPPRRSTRSSKKPPSRVRGPRRS